MIEAIPPSMKDRKVERVNKKLYCPPKNPSGQAGVASESVGFANFMEYAGTSDAEQENCGVNDKVK